MPPPTLGLWGRRLPTFLVCGVVGFVLASGTALVLASSLQLSVPVFALLISASAVTFFAIAYATRAIQGSERLVYYHHELAVLSVSALAIRALGRPLLPYLDVVSVALAVFLVFGRLGCFAVGCCHGRPHPAGVRYGDAHAREGFAYCLVGVPLLPTQLFESLAVFVTTVIAIARLIGGSRAGEVLATQLVLYAAIRFTLELLRGDETRPTWRGFSEAQWTSLALALSVVAAEHARLLPAASWHAVVVASLASVLVVLAVLRLRSESPHRLLSPAHIHEVAEVLARGGSRQDQPISVCKTSLGVCLSSCTIDDGGVLFRIHTLSGVGDAGARTVSKLIARIEGVGGGHELVRARPGVMQLILPVAPGAGRPALASKQRTGAPLTGRSGAG